MNKLALASVLLAVSLSACAQAPAAPISVSESSPPVAPASSPSLTQTPAFPVTLNGPDGTALLLIEADGSVKGDRTKMLALLAKQTGGDPRDNILVALLIRALRDDAKQDAAASPSPAVSPVLTKH